MPDLTGSCDAKVETCGDGISKCASMTGEQSIGPAKITVTIRRCADTCEPGTKQPWIGGKATLHCCDTDLCNAA
ncbi:hypothetical protein M9458_042877, partial [Cirrhinus mrigala]